MSLKPSRTHNTKGRELSKSEIEWRNRENYRDARSRKASEENRQRQERTFEQFERELDGDRYGR